MADFVVGTESSDTIDTNWPNRTPANDETIAGLGGSDLIFGLGGADTIDGGADSDTIDGGEGADRVDGGSGDDQIVYDQADVSVMGGEGQDRLVMTTATTVDLNSTVDQLVGGGVALGFEHLDATAVQTGMAIAGSNVANEILAGLGADSIFGLDGNDTLYGFGGADSIVGGTGFDLIYGDLGADTLEGGQDNDYIDGGENDDRLKGDDGADTLEGGLGSDTLTGGAGADVFVVNRRSPRSDTSPTTADHIADFRGASGTEADVIDLVVNFGLPLAFNGYLAFELPDLSGNQGQVLPYANDGFADVVYQHLDGKTVIAVDVDDDGAWSEIDEIIYLDNGTFTLNPNDFRDNFSVIRGTPGDDLRKGGENAETYFMLAGNDTVEANGGDDSVKGAAGNDSLSGGLGNDTLEGGDDADRLSGDSNNDALLGDAGADTIIGGDGLDQLYGGADADTITGGTGEDQLFGEAGADTLDGGDQDDFLDGGDNDDTLTGGAGKDGLQGGFGNDSLMGGADADTLQGGGGADTLTGGGDVDRFVVNIFGESPPTAPDIITDFEGGGQAGGDVLQLTGFAFNTPLVFNDQAKPFVVDLSGDSGLQFPYAADGLLDVIWYHDTATGETRVAVDTNDDGYFGSNDVYFVLLNGPTTLAVGDFVDTFRVFRLTAGNDTRTFSDISETVYALGGNDSIVANGGEDVIYAGTGNDTVSGGAGDDTVEGDAGLDSIVGGAGHDVLSGGTSNDTLSGGDDADQLYGESANDYLVGGNGDDQLSGDVGLDTLTGGDGGDVLSGGSGDDQLTGGAGDDYLDPGEGGGFANGGQGQDTLVSYDGAFAVTLTGGTEVDAFRFSTNNGPASKLGAIDLVSDFAGAGAVGGDTLAISHGSQPWAFDGLRSFTPTSGAVIGSIANDGFVDVSYARSGGDTYVVADLNDDGRLDADDLIIRFTGSLTFTADDFVDTFNVIRLTAGNDTRSFTDADEIIYAQGGNDSVDAGGGQDSLFGGTGNDTLQGNAGSDTVAGEAGLDSVLGGAGNDVLSGGTSNDTLRGGDDADQLYGETADDLLYGDAGGDQLSGDVGLDTLHGGADRDALYGGSGDDQLYGEDGDDYLDPETGGGFADGGQGQDTLASSDAAYVVTLIGGTENDLFRISAANGAASKLGAIDIVSDFEGAGAVGGDTLAITHSGQLWAFDGLRNFAPTSGAMIGSIANDGFVDVSYTRSGGATYVVADLNDDGRLDGNDLVVRLNGSLTLTADDFVETFNVIRLTSRNDVRTFTDADEIVYAQGGDDVVYALGGQDSVFGGTGNDTLSGGAGDDTLEGEAGLDSIVGGAGIDILTGGSSNDTLSGGDDGDQLYGGTANDYLVGGFGSDQLSGDEGTDTLSGGGDGDVLYGGSGDDQLSGGDGDDYLDSGLGGGSVTGGQGQDTIFSYDGASVLTMTGGINADLFSVSARGVVSSTLAKTDVITDFEETDAGGADRIQIEHFPNDYLAFDGYRSFALAVGATIGSAAGDGFIDVSFTYDETGAVIVADMDDDGVLDATDFVLRMGDFDELSEADFVNTFLAIRLTDQADIAAFTEEADAVFALGGDDSITALGGSDVIRGGAGDDTLLGGDDADTLGGDDGADSLVGGLGVDNLDGGAGNDTVVGGDDSDTLYGGFDNDLLQGGFGFDILSGEEGRDTLQGGADDDALYGGDDDDRLEGGDGADFLDGGTGDDVMFGGAGDDSFDGGDGLDVVSYVGSLAGLTAHLTTPASNTGAATGDTYVRVEGLIGTSYNDRLFGDGANNVLAGGGGADLLNGGAGSDTASYQFATSSVTANLAAPAQNAGEATGDTYFSIENLTGSTYADTLRGTSAANVLNGGGGADSLYGGAGDDRYVVDDAGDMVVELAGEGADTIESSASFSLSGLNVETLVLTGTGAINGTGSTGADALIGNAGANILNGGAGADTLTGGAGLDTFFFSTPLGSTNVDQVLDFSSADDTIRLARATFTTLSLGALPGAAFVVAETAQDSSDRIVYDSATGRLFYDDDGTGAHAQRLFAQLTPGAFLAADDFRIT